jgi:hypothetical protein
VLCKRNCADDDLVHGLIAKTCFLEDQRISVNACEDACNPFAIGQDDSPWGFLVAFPEQSCPLSFTIGE